MGQGVCGFFRFHLSTKPSGAEMGGRSAAAQSKPKVRKGELMPKRTGIRTPSIRSEGMGKKRNKMDLFLLPGIPTDNDLEELADTLLAGSQGQNKKRPKRDSSLSEESAGSVKTKGRGSEGRSRPRSPGTRGSSGGVGGGKRKHGKHNRKFAQE